MADEYEPERGAAGARRRKAQNDKNPREKSGAPCAVVGSSVEVGKKFKRAPAARAGSALSIYLPGLDCNFGVIGPKKFQNVEKSPKVVPPAAAAVPVCASFVAASPEFGFAVVRGVCIAKNGILRSFLMVFGGFGLGSHKS